MTFCGIFISAIFTLKIKQNLPQNEGCRVILFIATVTLTLGSGLQNANPFELNAKFHQNLSQYESCSLMIRNVDDQTMPYHNLCPVGNGRRTSEF